MGRIIFFSQDAPISYFTHRKIIEYCNRPYPDVYTMDSAMVNNWNDVVSPKDTVYHLGDLIFGNEKNPKAAAELLASLNGRIILIKGSHDKIAYTPMCIKRFEHIYPTYELRYNSKVIFLAHHLHKIWPKSHYNSWHCYSHSHGHMDAYARTEGKIMDVGADAEYSNFTPLHIETIVKVMNTRPDNFNCLDKCKGT